MQELENQIRVWCPSVQLTREDVERMRSDPVTMYLHSLRTRSRLPDELHESMLIHSLDPASSENVKSYLEWVSACEEREERMVVFHRREKMIDRIMLCSVVLGMVGYAILILMVAFK